MTLYTSVYVETVILFVLNITIPFISVLPTWPSHLIGRHSGGPPLHPVHDTGTHNADYQRGPATDGRQTRISHSDSLRLQVSVRRAGPRPGRCVGALPGPSDSQLAAGSRRQRENPAQHGDQLSAGGSAFA